MFISCAREAAGEIDRGEQLSTAIRPVLDCDHCVYYIMLNFMYNIEQSSILIHTLTRVLLTDRFIA